MNTDMKEGSGKSRRITVGEQSSPMVSAAYKHKSNLITDLIFYNDNTVHYTQTSFSTYDDNFKKYPQLIGDTYYSVVLDKIRNSILNTGAWVKILWVLDG